MEKQKLLLTLTIFTDDVELITYMATEYIDQLTKILKYKVISQTSGQHKEASRTHFHIMYNIMIEEGKMYKTLNQTLIRNHNKLTFPSKKLADQFNETEIKISFIHEGETKKLKSKVIQYGETFMRYVFKEYTHRDQIIMEHQRNIEPEILESYRKQAHQEWLVIKQKREQQTLNEIQAKDDHMRMKEFIIKGIEKLGDYATITDKIEKTMELIWTYKTDMYKVGHVKSVRVASIEDQAISFLVFNNYIEPTEIVQLTKRKYI